MARPNPSATSSFARILSFPDIDPKGTIPCDLPFSITLVGYSCNAETNCYSFELISSSGIVSLTEYALTALHFLKTYNLQELDFKVVNTERYQKILRIRRGKKGIEIIDPNDDPLLPVELRNPDPTWYDIVTFANTALKHYVLAKEGES